MENSGASPNHPATPRLRFPKSARLNRSAEFLKVRRAGTSHHGRSIVLNALKISETDETRVGLITSRRIGGAVIRNRVRRRLRELVRMTRPKFKRGFFVVVVARKAAAEISFQALRDEWLRLATRASILMQTAEAPAP